MNQTEREREKSRVESILAIPLKYLLALKTYAVIQRKYMRKLGNRNTSSAVTAEHAKVLQHFGRNDDERDHDMQSIHNTSTPIETVANISTNGSVEETVTMIIDSGATINVIRKENRLSNKKDTDIICKDAGGNNHKATCIGDIEAEVTTQQGRKRIVIKDVICIPQFHVDILSTGMIRSCGFKIELPAHDATGFTTTPSGDKIAHTKKSGSKLEYMELHPITPATEGVYTTASNALVFDEWLDSVDRNALIKRIQDPLPDDSQHMQSKIQNKLAAQACYVPMKGKEASDAWMKLHILAGHTNARVLTRLTRDHFTGTQAEKLGIPANIFCRACNLSKSKRISIAKKKEGTRPPPKRPWERASMDVIGKMKHRSVFGGHEYMVIFVDHYSKQVRLYPLKSVKTIHETIDSHLMWVKMNHPKVMEEGDYENEFQATKNSAFVQSDAAAYFRTKMCRAVYAKHLINQISSPPYSQAKNGLCERWWGTIKASAAAMRASRELGPEWWYISARHAAMIHTYLPTSGNPEHKPPHTMLTGNKVTDLNQFHMFGSEATVNRPSEHIREGQVKGIPGMYIGLDTRDGSHMVAVPPSTGGPEELKKYQLTQIGALPSRARATILRSMHCKFTDDIPLSIIKGDIPIVGADYHAADEEDDEPMYIDYYDKGEHRIGVPEDNRARDSSELDLDWHAVNCIVTNKCECNTINIDVNGEATQYKVMIQTTAAMRRDTGLPEEGDDPLVHDPLHIPSVFAVDTVHKNWKSAKKSVHRAHYELAKNKEWKQLTETYKVMSPIKKSQIPSEEKIYPSMMNFTLKHNAENEIIKGKARLCFGGHLMKEGIDYDPEESFCPGWSSIRLFLATAAAEGKRIRTGDISGAYLQGRMQKTLYMHSPHDQKEYDPETGEEILWAVHGNLYGTKLAAAVWYQDLTTYLESIGFSHNKREPCIFTRRKLRIARGDKSSNTYSEVKLCVYVDDLAYYGSDEHAVGEFEREIQTKYGDISPSDPKLYLGANLIQGEGYIHLSSKAMIERVAERFYPHLKISEVNTSKSRVPFPAKESALGEEVLIKDCPDIANGEARSQTPYREIVGALSYIAITCRPDISFYTSQLARVQSNHGDKHFQLAKHVLKYLLNTSEYGCTYRKGVSKVEYFVDASWANVTPTYVTNAKGESVTVANDDGRKSAYGYVGYYAGGPISWAARMNKGRRPLSSTESELCAATECAKDIIHVRELAHIMDIKMDGPTKIHEDNRSTIAQILREGITKRSRHIEIRWFYCQDLQKDGIIDVVWHPTNEMTADIFTKRLPEALFSKFRDKLVERPPQMK